MTYTTTRLLLPFTERIDGQAINYALRTAKQLCATLVPLALIRVRPGKRARAEYMQQAQDFLVLTRTRAQRYGVAIEQAQLYTSDPVRSIEAFAGEMHCEAILLFPERRPVLLGQREMQALIISLGQRVNIILLSSSQGEKTGAPLSASLTQCASREQPVSLFPGQQTGSLLQRLLSSVHLHG
ncbi:MAG TPA: hypothetical protein VFN35_28960 [Ktedonobacteraceae bacterium]|nr:hypothetical protein [Ktedonobacteraceae bacterium]